MDVESGLRTEGNLPVDRSTTSELPDVNITPLTKRASQFESSFQNLHLAARLAKRLALILLTLSGVASDSKPVLSQNIAGNSPKSGENNLVLENTPPSEKAFQNLPAYPPTNVEQTRHPEAVTVLSNYSVEGFSASGSPDNSKIYGLVTDKDTGKQFAVGIGIDPNTKGVNFERYIESPIKGDSFLVAENNPKVGAIIGKDLTGKFVASITKDGWKTKNSIEIGGIGGKTLQMSPDGKYLLLSRRNEDGSADVVRVNLIDASTKRLPVSGVGSENLIMSATRLTTAGIDNYFGYGVVVSWSGYFKFEFRSDYVLVTNLNPEDGSPDDRLVVFNDNQGRNRVWLFNNHFSNGGAIMENVNGGSATIIRPDLSQYKYPQGGAFVGAACPDLPLDIGYMGTTQPGVNGEENGYVEMFSLSDPKMKHKLVNNDGEWPTNAGITDLYIVQNKNEKILVAVTATRNSSGDGFLTATYSRRITNGINSTDVWKKIIDVRPASGAPIGSQFTVYLPAVLDSTTAGK